MKIYVYPNKLDLSVFEFLESEKQQTLNDWLMSNVPEYSPEGPFLFSAFCHDVQLNKLEIQNKILTADDVVKIYIEPKDPATIIMAVVAVASAAYSIYMANKYQNDIYNSSTPTGSSIYSPNAQGNQVRLMGIVPELAGTHGVYPDLINAPHRYFENGNEFLELLMCVSVGECYFTEDNIKIAETPANRYSDSLEIEKFSPGESVINNSCHRHFFTSAEVGSNGFELKGESNFYKGIDNPLDFIQLGNHAINLETARESEFKRSWKVGDTIFINGNNNNIKRFEGFVKFEGNKVKSLKNSLLSVGAVDDVIIIMGHGEHDKGYILESVTSSEITIKSLDNGPVDLGFYDDIYIYIAKPNENMGLFEILEHPDPTEERFVVNKLDVLNWSGFPIDDGYDNFSGMNITLINGVIKNNIIGPFLCCPENEETELLEIDFFIPGLVRIENTGAISSVQVDVEIRYKKVGDLNYTTLLHSFTNDSLDEYGETISIPVAPGVYEIEIERTSGMYNDTSVRDKVVLKRLKSELKTVFNYEDVTTIAIKIKGSQALSESAENKILIESTRVLPTLKNGSWASAEQTNKIADFYAYMLSDSGYSSDSIDLIQLQELADKCTYQNQTFNAVFDNESTLFESLKRVLKAGNSEPVLEFGQINPVLDEPRTFFEQMYQADNILAPGITQTFKFFDADEPDGIEVEYVNPETWKPETVNCFLDSDLGIKPKKVRFFGVTNKLQAWRLGMRFRNKLRYQRVNYDFKTEMDGLNSNYLSYCSLAEDMPGYSQTGIVEKINGNVITVDRDLEFTTGNHYIALRKPDGSLDGPHLCVLVSENAVSISGALSFNPDFSGNIDFPLFQFGTAETLSYPVLIKKIKPSGTDKVSVTAVNYDVRVFSHDLAILPDDL